MTLAWTLWLHMVDEYEGSLAALRGRRLVRFAWQLNGTLHASIKTDVASAFVQSGNELREMNASPLVTRQITKASRPLNPA